jgi:kynurenine--oxoglutarate transaminase/cysteine-S-conjugate beta-lyase/glutamine--phenylpyruvate transaminase
MSYADRLRGFEALIVWHEFTLLAQKHGAVNLGQGFPDWPCPPFLKEALKRAVDADHNQYTRSGGHLRLVQELASRYSSKLGRAIDPLTEVTTSVGATEGIFAACQAFINSGDEVVVFEPAFDIYSAQVQMAGGVCRYVPLRPVLCKDKGFDWVFDPAEFAAAFSPRTRMVLLNSPHNPTGKIFSMEEMKVICAEVKRHKDVVVVSDEVYDQLVYDGAGFQHVASLPGMWERTLTVCSSGKTFSVTGWKVGWLVGPATLIKPIMLANQWVQFSVPTTLQEAVAEALVVADRPFEGFADFYSWLRNQYESKRNKFMATLTEAGLTPSRPDGGFFIMANTSAFKVDESFLKETTPAAPIMTRDWAFCRMLTIKYGVAAIPPSAFFCLQNKAVAANFARFAFCKTDESLD